MDELKQLFLPRSSKLVSEGFKMCIADNSFFVKKNATCVIIIVVYIDDIIITRRNQGMIEETKNIMKNTLT